MTTITQQIIDLKKATYLGKFENGSPEWHDAREGIGGSDIGTIMGLNPWKSAFTLWAERVGLVDTNNSETYAMGLGTFLEPFIRDRWAAENSAFLTVHETGTWQSTTNPNFKANPDGIIEWADGQLGILEIKYTSSYWSTLPPAYEAQVNWYLHTLGLNKGIIVALVAGRPQEFVIEYNADTAKEYEQRAALFLSHVNTGIHPDWDGSASTYETVRHIAPGLQDGSTDLGDLWIHLSNAKAAYEAAEAQFTQVKSATLAQMDGIKTGTYEGEPVITLQASKNGPFIKFNK